MATARHSTFPEHGCGSATARSCIWWGGATRVRRKRAGLKKAGFPFRETSVPGRPLHQIFVVDPDGVQIELNVEVAD